MISDCSTGSLSSPTYSQTLMCRSPQLTPNALLWQPPEVTTVPHPTGGRRQDSGLGLCVPFTDFRSVLM